MDINSVDDDKTFDIQTIELTLDDKLKLRMHPELVTFMSLNIQNHH